MSADPGANAARPYIGGQAVIEGVMMRSPTGLAVAVRRPNGEIVVREGPVAGSSGAWRKWPLVRGVVTLVESMSLGYKALQFSADQQMVPASGTELADSRGEVAPVAGVAKADADAGSGGTRVMMLVSMLFAIGLFVALPQGLAAGLCRLLGWDLGVQDFAFHALTGGFKLLVLTGYMLFISRIEEIRRVFQYHGAEHKTIYAYEAGLPLTVENVKAQSALHPRCGTTFLIVVVVLSILIGSAVTPIVLPHAEGIFGQIQTLALRITLLVPTAAIGYELQRFSARHLSTGPLRFVNYPGFLFQKITTREPDAQQIEVAIAAMQSAVWREKVGVTATSDERTEVFGSLEGVLARFGAPQPAE
ncbi:MAG: DUF1385 domain-containing protein [Deltaproteobacteria bacterium]|nr:DUF1385 domain-containing protein [Deltaproteobacteria bacterium]